MTPETIGLIQVAATLIAGAGLIFSGCSFWYMTQNTLMEGLFRFQERINSSLKEVTTATDETIVARLRDHLNFLETCCIALQKRVVPKGLQQVVIDSVVDHLATLQALEQWHPVLESSVTHPRTFDGIQAFIREHKSTIDALAAKRLPVP